MRRFRLSVASIIAVFALLACGDSEPSTEASILVRTVPPLIVTPINAEVFCGSPEVLVAEGELGFLGQDPIVGPVWAALFQDLPPGDCSTSLVGGELDVEPFCTGDASFTLTAGMLSEITVVMTCTSSEEES